MKKLLAILILSSFVVGGSLFAQKGGFANPAQGGGKGGFQSIAAGQTILSVAEAKAQPDDAMVWLRGSIIEQLGDEKYRFKDSATDETIVIEIDDDKWNGLVVNESDVILIYGEVDKALLSATEIDVKEVRKAPPARRRDRPAAAAGCTDCGCGASQAK